MSALKLHRQPPRDKRGPQPSPWLLKFMELLQERGRKMNSKEGK